MVWIIPKDSDEKMIRRLICLMTNIETNKTIFDADGVAVNSQEPFNTYENEYFAEEYRFVKGYIRCTGVTITNSNLEEKMNLMSAHMRKDVSLDLNYCYPTAHYTVARIPTNNEYSRLIAYSDQKMKNIKYKYNFIWINAPFELSDFQELKYKTSKCPSYELMRSLSTIIYDNGGIFSTDYTGMPITSNKLIHNINFPEIWQVYGSHRIVNIPISLSDKFGIRNNIRKRFEHLIPDTKKFAPNRALYKDKHVPYREGIVMHDGFNITESKPINEINIPALDIKESIIKKIKSKDSVYQMIRMNVNESNKNQLTMEVIMKFLSCHACFTPLYGKFYYILAEHKEAQPTPHIPICAMCMHNNHMGDVGQLNVGISQSPLLPSNIISLIPRPNNVSYENYEKYKSIMDQLNDKVIEVESDNHSGVLASFDNVKLVSAVTNSMLFEGDQSTIFIIELTK